MYDLKIYRQEWLDAFYFGNTEMLHYIECVDFHIERDSLIIKKKSRIDGIEKRKKINLWNPKRVEYYNLNYNFISEVECIVTSFCYNDKCKKIFYEETWLIKDGMWKVRKLIVK